VIWRKEFLLQLKDMVDCTMGWLAVLGLISIVFILAGCSLALRRVRRYRQETEARRTRAFAEMAEIGKKQGEGRRAQGAEKEDVERTLRQGSGQGMQNVE
jgi:hypothetical protein